MITLFADQIDEACKGVRIASGKADCGSAALGGAFSNIANVLVFLVGAISVIMIIIGALRYVLSAGDSAGIKSAKDTIMYALVGVVVALVAYALVAYVSGQVT